MNIGVSVKYQLFLSCFNKILIFFRQVLEKILKTKFHENPSCGSRVVPCGQTDRHEANGRFPQFCASPCKKTKKIRGTYVKREMRE